MRKKVFQSNILLLLASIIWGFAFIAQRVGIKYVGSFTFNGIRFALGTISLIPLLLVTNYRTKKNKLNKSQPKNKKSFETFKAGIIIGLMLFAE